MNRIAELREKHGLTQKKLGQKLAVGQTTVSAWEKGKNEPSGKKLIEMAQMFGVTVEYLLGIDEIATEPKQYDVNFRCYFPGAGNHTNHHCTMPLKEVERWVESYYFTHPNVESITVKVWFKSFESVDTKEK